MTIKPRYTSILDTQRGRERQRGTKRENEKEKEKWGAEEERERERERYLQYFNLPPSLQRCTRENRASSKSGGSYGSTKRIRAQDAIQSDQSAHQVPVGPKESRVCVTTVGGQDAPRGRGPPLDFKVDAHRVCIRLESLNDVPAKDAFQRAPTTSVTHHESLAMETTGIPTPCGEGPLGIRHGAGQFISAHRPWAGQQTPSVQQTW